MKIQVCVRCKKRPASVYITRLDGGNSINEGLCFQCAAELGIKPPPVVDMLKKIYERGHEIGNHGYYHKDQDKLSYDQNKEEIEMCHKVVKSIINYDMKLFAPPSGAFSQNTLDACQELGYQTIMWTYDTIDWRDHDTSLILKRATNKAGGGSLILSHPTDNTLQALPEILKYYKNLKNESIY